MGDCAWELLVKLARVKMLTLLRDRWTESKVEALSKYLKIAKVGSSWVKRGSRS